MPKKVFSWSPIRSIMKKCGAEMVAKDAVDALIDHLVKLTKDITDSALEFSRHAGRKKMISADIELAIKTLGGPFDEPGR